MTLKELLEAAHLDALGLLEEDERAAFEAAFASANPTIQATVRAEQARWATTVAELSSEEPPADLKQRVLSAVGQAMGESGGDDTTALLTESRLGREIIGTIGASSRGTTRSARVSPAWRAASLGFAMAAAVLLASFLSVSRQIESLRQNARNEASLEAVAKGYGRDIYNEALFGKGNIHAVFDRVSTASVASDRPEPVASVLYLPGKSETRLWVQHLSVGNGQSARIVTVNEKNEVQEQLGEFFPSGQVYTQSLAIQPEPGLRLAIAIAPVGRAATSADVVLVTAFSA